VREHKSFVFKFEDIEVRESEFALTRAGETVKVEPTAFRVLLYLLRNHGRLVTKDEIMAAVWHDTAVSDNSLTRSVATLRRVLDDSSREPRYIATVQTLGYRFLVRVEKYPASSEQIGEPETPSVRSAPAPRKTIFMLATGAVVVAAIGGIWWLEAGLPIRPDQRSSSSRIIQTTTPSPALQFRRTASILHMQTWAGSTSS
jgi:DNA-binding winged helix-turn-helix (wHTH) protein